MTVLITTLVAVAAGTVMATSAFARARHIRGPTPLLAIRNESMTLDKLQYPARTRTTRPLRRHGGRACVRPFRLLHPQLQPDHCSHRKHVDAQASTRRAAGAAPLFAAELRAALKSLR